MAEAPPADATPTLRRSPRWRRRFVVASRKASVYVFLEVVAALAFAIMAWLIWYKFTVIPPGGQMLPSRQVAGLLLGTLLPAMALVVLFGRRLALRRAAGTTARMHVRLVFFFSLVATIPTLLVAAFAAFLFQSGVDFWFSDNSRGMMQNANNLARGYYEQNQLQVTSQSVAMANDVGYYLSFLKITEPDFADVYRQQLQNRDLTRSGNLPEDCPTERCAPPRWQISSRITRRSASPKSRCRPSTAANRRSSRVTIRRSELSYRSTSEPGFSCIPPEIPRRSASASGATPSPSSPPTTTSHGARARCSCVSTSRCSSSASRWSGSRCGSRCALPTGRWRR